MLDQVQGRDAHTAVEERLLDELLGDADRVLEAGCGRTSRLVQHRSRIAELVGVDVDVDAGRANAALDRFVAADLCRPLPFEDGTFDLVYANFVIEHLGEPLAAFREWRRVLRPGGSALVLTSNGASPALRAARLLPHRGRVAFKRSVTGACERDVFPAVYRANDRSRLHRLFGAAGFEPVELVTVGTLHRYAGGHRKLAEVLRTSERLLPEGRRSTIVAWYRARAGRRAVPPATLL
jgi:SAM-dependent methyltransferase